MSYVWGFFYWLWSKKYFLIVTIASIPCFLALLFPFNDLSDLVTSSVSKASGNQLYVQFDTMNLHFVPAPSISATGLSVETGGLPPIKAKWMKVAPSWVTVLLNSWTLKKAADGDVEASNSLSTRLGLSVSAEDVLGADVDLSFGPGAKSEKGWERSRVSLAMEQLNLGELQKWSALSIPMSGKADLKTEWLFVPDWREQPDGQLELKIKALNIPASTVMIPMGEASMPLNLPQLTLAQVILKGRLSGGNLVLEESRFGEGRDPLSGRIKGQVALEFVKDAVSQQRIPRLGRYTVTVELNTTKAIEKELGVAFLFFDSAKMLTPSGARYLFRAAGDGFLNVPSITRLATF